MDRKRIKKIGLWIVGGIFGLPIALIVVVLVVALLFEVTRVSTQPPKKVVEAPKNVPEKVVEVQKSAPKKVVKTQSDTIPVDPPQKLYVIPGKLNVRAGPGMNYKVNETISGSGGTFYVRVIAICGNWVELKSTWWHSGGWVYRKYLGSKEVAEAAKQKREAAGRRRRPAQDEWLSAGMRIYPGVKIYYGDGPQKRYVGTVIETGQIDGKRAVLLEPGGWKYRNSLIQWGWVLRSQYEEAKRRYLGE